MILRSFILLLYLAMTSHVHISLHFCCDEMVSWSLFSKAEDCGGKNCTKKSCCRDTEISFEDSGDHSTPEYIQVFSLNNLAFSPPSVFVINEAPGQIDAQFETSHAPPNLALRKIYLLCEVFRL